jgi:C4-dicarboxylate-specific signal transduction histidine kinase
MPAPYKRCLRKEVASGKAELPEELTFLVRVNYFAIAQQRVEGYRVWHVEVLGSWLKSLLTTKKKLLEARSKLRTLSAERQELESKLRLLEKQNADLSANNKQLMQNIEADQKLDRFTRSPKNYFNAAEDHAFTPKSLPIQGGSAGLEKR